MDVSELLKLCKNSMGKDIAAEKHSVSAQNCDEGVTFAGSCLVHLCHWHAAALGVVRRCAQRSRVQVDVRGTMRSSHKPTPARDFAGVSESREAVKQGPAQQALLSPPLAIQKQSRVALDSRKHSEGPRRFRRVAAGGRLGGYVWRVLLIQKSN